MPEPDLICLKCGAKWSSEYLERKRVRSCLLCKEPGLRYMDINGNATVDTFPKKIVDEIG